MPPKRTPTSATRNSGVMHRPLGSPLPARQRGGEGSGVGGALLRPNSQKAPHPATRASVPPPPGGRGGGGGVGGGGCFASTKLTKSPPPGSLRSPPSPPLASLAG